MEGLGTGTGYNNSLMPRTNHDGYGPYRGRVALVTTAVLTSISAFVVALRFFTRVWLVKYVGRDDWTILAALTFSLVYLAMTESQVHFGLGYHSSTLSQEELSQQLKRLWVAIPFYNASLSTTKLSILFQYLRIFPNRRFRLSCYLVISLVVAFGIWAVVSGFLNCVPVERFWDDSVQGHCLSFAGVWLFNASFNMATDLTLLVLPMPMLLHLQLPRRQRNGLMVLFALGGLVVLISAFRFYSIYLLAKKDADASWTNAISAAWTAAECNTAILCASLPPLRPLVSRLFPKMLSTDSATIRNNNNNNNAAATGNLNNSNNTYNETPDMEEIYIPERQFYDFDYDLALARTGVKMSDWDPRRLGGGGGGGGNGGGIEVTTEVTTEVHSAHSHRHHHGGGSHGGGGGSGSGMLVREETNSERRLIVR